MKEVLRTAVVLFALLASGCAGARGDSPDSPDSKGDSSSKKHSSGKTPYTVVPPEEQDESEVDSEGKKWSGWRYKGKRDDCFYVVGRRCYKSQKKACKAAGCATADCRTSGAGPAKVICPKS